MRYILILFSFIFLFNIGISQDVFPDEYHNQQWEYVTWYFWGGRCENRIIVTGEVANKCDQDYIEIWDCNENLRHCWLIGYYRNQNDSVLVRTNYPYLHGRQDTVICDEGEGLAYDFSAQENDTLVCQINGSSRTKFWKTGEELIEYEGVERQTLNMKYIPYRNAPQILYPMRWIEGIGSNVHPFYSLSCIGDHCELEQQLTKVTRNEKVIYLDTMLTFSFPCTGWITSNEEVERSGSEFQLYPNPAFNELNILASEYQNLSMNIYNSLGELVLERKSFWTAEKIDISRLKNGLYFVEIIASDYHQSLKLMKK